MNEGKPTERHEITAAVTEDDVKKLIAESEGAGNGIEGIENS
jgi:hypothetical protein